MWWIPLTPLDSYCTHVDRVEWEVLRTTPFLATCCFMLASFLIARFPCHSFERVPPVVGLIPGSYLCFRFGSFDELIAALQLRLDVSAVDSPAS